MQHPNLYLEKRLIDWSYWIARIENGEEGWPKSSLLAIVLELGAVIRSGIPRTPFVYEKAEEVNCWINRMGKEYPEYEEVIKKYYLRKNISLRAAAKELNISWTTFKDRVREAKNWLGQRINEDQQDYLLKPAHFG